MEHRIERSAKLSRCELAIERPLIVDLYQRGCLGTQLVITLCTRTCQPESHRTSLSGQQRPITTHPGCDASANVTVAAGTRATVSPADSSRYGFPSMSVRESRNLRASRYGKIAYRHVADTYIALFSRFIPCGVWEAV